MVLDLIICLLAGKQLGIFLGPSGFNSYFFHTFPHFFTMKKAYSHFALLVLAAASFSSCSRADYASNTTAKSDLAVASPMQVPVSPAADMSASVVAAKPLPTATEAAPVATAAPAAAVVAAAPVAPAAPSRATTSAPVATTQPAVADAPAAKAAKPSLVQRLALNKITKQLSKIDKRQQNTASTTESAARGGSLTILLVGLIVLLIGIIVGSGLLNTIGAILTVVGLVLLLLKAL